MVLHNVDGRNIVYKGKPEYLGSVQVSNSQVLEKWLTKNGVQYRYRTIKVA